MVLQKSGLRGGMKCHELPHGTFDEDSLSVRSLPWWACR